MNRTLENGETMVAGWNGDHYIDKQGYEYPATGEEWDGFDREAYAWNAFVEYVETNPNMIMDELSDKLSKVERDAERSGEDDSAELENLRYSIDDLRKELDASEYVSAAETYDDIMRHYDTGYGFVGGWRGINADGNVTLSEDELTALDSSIPALDRNGVVYAFSDDSDED